MNQIWDFLTFLGLVFSQNCLIKFTFKQTKVKKSKDISAIMRKFLSLLWLKSDKNVKWTKVEKSRCVSNCLDKGSLTSRRGSRWITFNRTKIFLIQDLEAKTGPRKKRAEMRSVSSFAQHWSGKPEISYRAVSYLSGYVSLLLNLAAHASYFPCVGVWLNPHVITSWGYQWPLL
jgi:hypothetical protein